MSSGPNPESVPPGVPFVPQGPVPFIATTNPNTMDYPRLVYTAPRFEVVAIADIIEPSVLEACEALLPTLVPPYVNQAAIDAVNATAVRRAGDTMTGPLNLSPVIPTANAMAASKQYVDTMIATGAIPEVPPVPAGQAWARQTGQWIPLAGGGTVTNIATGAGLTGGPITATGTISMANMNANTLKGNNTGAVAAPTDLSVGQVMAMLGAAPLNSPAFTGSPSLPTGTAAVTQLGGTNNTSVATTAFVASTIAAQYPVPIANGGTNATTAPTALTNLGAAPLASPTFTGTVTIPSGASIAGYALLASPVFTGNPQGPTPATADNSVSLATTAFVKAQSYATTAALAGYLPLSGGTLTGGLTGTTLTLSGTLSGAGATFSGTVNAQNSAVNIQGTVANGDPALVIYDRFGTVRSALQFFYTTGQLQLTNTAPGPNSSIYLPNDGSFGTTSATAVKPGGGPWTAPSDVRIKTVAGPYDKGLADVVGLNPVVYTYKGNDAPPDGTSPNAAVAEAQTPFVGLIAQEVEPIFPGMVRMTAGYIDGAAVDDLRQLDTTPLIFALVNAVKELSTRLTTLEGRAP